MGVLAQKEHKREPLSCVRMLGCTYLGCAYLGCAYLGFVFGF